MFGIYFLRISLFLFLFFRLALAFFVWSSFFFNFHTKNSVAIEKKYRSKYLLMCEKKTEKNRSVCKLGPKTKAWAAVGVSSPPLLGKRRFHPYANASLIHIGSPLKAFKRRSRNMTAMKESTRMLFAKHTIVAAVNDSKCGTSFFANHSIVSNDNELSRPFSHFLYCIQRYPLYSPRNGDLVTISYEGKRASPFFCALKNDMLFWSLPLIK
jgi:hypothetical protein